MNNRMCRDYLMHASSRQQAYGPNDKHTPMQGPVQPVNYPSSFIGPKPKGQFQGEDGRFDKQAYNKWYYRNNDGEWKPGGKYYRLKDKVTFGLNRAKSRATDYVKNKEYKEDWPAGARIISNAARNARNSFNDAWGTGAGMITNAGKNYGNTWKQGAGMITNAARNARNSFNDAWGTGAGMITNAGKNYGNTWRQGAGMMSNAARNARNSFNDAWGTGAGMITSPFKKKSK